MNKPNFSLIAKKVGASVSKHSPEILTGIGIAGMITTTVLAVRSTPKALKLIEEKKKADRVEKLTAIETVKTTWKCYIPAAVTGVVSVTCLIGASSVHVRRNAALATAYKLSETALSDYREKVVETVGEKKEQAIREKVAEKHVENNPVNESTVIMTGHGNTLCFDPMSGRHFYSDIDKIRKAENELNRKMLHDMFGYATLNDFYDELGLDRTDIGDIVGWNTSNLVEMGFSSHVTNDGRPSIVLDYRQRPDYNYDRM